MTPTLRIARVAARQAFRESNPALKKVVLVSSLETDEELFREEGRVEYANAAKKYLALAKQSKNLDDFLRQVGVSKADLMTKP